MTLPWRHVGTLYRRGEGTSDEGVENSAWSEVAGAALIEVDIQGSRSGLGSQPFGQEDRALRSIFFPDGTDVQADDRFVKASGPGPNDTFRILDPVDEGTGWGVEAEAEVTTEAIP